MRFAFSGTESDLQTGFASALIKTIYLHFRAPNEAVQGDPRIGYMQIVSKECLPGLQLEVFILRKFVSAKVIHTWPRGELLLANVM